MKTFKQYIEESNEIDESLNFISDLIRTGGPSSGKLSLSNSSRNFLSKSIKKQSLKLYRGIGLIPSRVNKSKIDEINNLKVEDDLPNYLFKSFNKFSSYSKKKSVAKYYSEGKLSIIIEADVPKSSIIVDLENLKSIINVDQTILDEDDFDYFKRDKEVIVEEPVKAKIIYINGRL